MVREKEEDGEVEIVMAEIENKANREWKSKWGRSGMRLYLFSITQVFRNNWRALLQNETFTI